MSPEALREELLTFRDLMSDRRVMTDLDRRDALGRSLAWAWIHCDDATEALTSQVLGSLDEFHMRSVMIDLRGSDV